MNRVSAIIFAAACAATSAFADGREAASAGPTPLNASREAGPVYHAPTAADCALAPGGQVYTSYGAGPETVRCAEDWAQPDRSVQLSGAPTSGDAGPDVQRGRSSRSWTSRSDGSPNTVRIDASNFSGGVGYDLVGAPYTGYGPVIVRIIEPVEPRNGVRIVRGRRP